MTIKKPKSDNTVFDDRCRDLLVEARDRGCANALNLLSVELANVTRRIALKVALTDRDSKDLFADESLALVFAPYVVHQKRIGKAAERSPRIFRFDPDRFVYERWCHKVLRNLWISERRKRNQEHTVENISIVEGFVQPDFLQLENPFSRADLSVIRSWTAGDRLMLLCLSGLFIKLHRSDWQGFISAAEDVFGFMLPVPFPMEQLLEAEDPSSRMSLLAKVFRVKINTLSVRWKRKKHLLRELSVVRDCAPDSELGN